MLNLRPYQVDLIERVRRELRLGKRTVLLQSPTGSGKTAVTAHMIKTAIGKGYRVWFVNHRREIIKQSVLTLMEAADLEVGIVAAGFPGNRHLPIQVCSVQTLARRRQLLPDPNLIIWDECHHVAASSWGGIHAAYPHAVHIGLTATPERLDGTGLSQWFQHIVTGPSVAKLIDEGWLSPYRLFAPGSPDLSAIHNVGGDYNKKELSEAMASSAVVGDALEHYRKYAMGRRAVVFMWSIESSIAIVQRFNDAGIPAAHLDGDTDDVTRDAIIDDFRTGKIKILSNVEIISEGFDLPSIEAAFLLRPTRSLGLYLQQVGRVLRPSPGKGEALIFDHAGNCRMHGLPDDERQWSLDGRVKKKRDSDACPVRQCPQCYAMMSAARAECKWCGFTFKTQSRGMTELEGELAEVDLEAQRRERKHEQSRAKSLDDLIRLGQLRGYKNPAKWAEHIWRARLAKDAARVAEQYVSSGQIPTGWR
jgi:DNA repair protein RadD